MHQIAFLKARNQAFQEENNIVLDRNHTENGCVLSEKEALL